MCSVGTNPTESQSWLLHYHVVVPNESNCVSEFSFFFFSFFIPGSRFLELVKLFFVRLACLKRKTRLGLFLAKTMKRFLSVSAGPTVLVTCSLRFKIIQGDFSFVTINESDLTCLLDQLPISELYSLAYLYFSSTSAFFTHCSKILECVCLTNVFLSASYLAADKGDQFVALVAFQLMLMKVVLLPFLPLLRLISIILEIVFLVSY